MSVSVHASVSDSYATNLWGFADRGHVKFAVENDAVHLMPVTAPSEMLPLFVI